MVKNQRSFVIVLLALGLLAALWAAYQRVRVESSNPIVALCLDYGEVQRLAALTGKTIEQQLVELREAGATHVALAESSLTDMLLLDRVSLIADSGRTRLVPQPGAEYVVEALAARLSAVEIEEYGVAGGTGPEEYELPSHRVPTAVWRGDFTGFGTIGVGYDPAALAAIAASGLQPVARPVADFCLTREALVWLPGDMWRHSRGFQLSDPLKRERLTIADIAEHCGMPFAHQLLELSYISAHRRLQIYVGPYVATRLGLKRRQGIL
jgi:hypothetical protein